MNRYSTRKYTVPISGLCDTTTVKPSPPKQMLSSDVKADRGLEKLVTRLPNSSMPPTAKPTMTSPNVTSSVVTSPTASRISSTSRPTPMKSRRNSTMYPSVKSIHTLRIAPAVSASCAATSISGTLKLTCSRHWIPSKTRRLDSEYETDETSSTHCTTHSA